MPVDYNFPAIGTEAIRGNINMANSNASLTSPDYYRLYPLPGTKWDVTRVIFYIEDKTSMDNGKFGGIAQLSNGIVLRKKDGSYKNFINIRCNGDLVVHAYNTEYTEGAGFFGAGSYSFKAVKKFAGQNEMGVIIRLDGNLPEEFQAIVRDDLTDLDIVYIMIQGHETIGE